MRPIVLIPATFRGRPFYGGTRSVTERLHTEVEGGACDIFNHWELPQPLHSTHGDQESGA